MPIEHIHNFCNIYHFIIVGVRSPVFVDRQQGLNSPNQIVIAHNIVSTEYFFIRVIVNSGDIRYDIVYESYKNPLLYCDTPSVSFSRGRKSGIILVQLLNFFPCRTVIGHILKQTVHLIIAHKLICKQAEIYIVIVIVIIAFVVHRIIVIYEYPLTGYPT